MCFSGAGFFTQHYDFVDCVAVIHSLSFCCMLTLQFINPLSCQWTFFLFKLVVITTVLLWALFYSSLGNFLQGYSLQTRHVYLWCERTVQGSGGPDIREPFSDLTLPYELGRWWAWEGPWEGVGIPFPSPCPTLPYHRKKTQGGIQEDKSARHQRDSFKISLRKWVT